MKTPGEWYARYDAYGKGLTGEPARASMSRSGTPTDISFICWKSIMSRKECGWRIATSLRIG